MSEPAIAKLVGEGVERPEASLPLDINYAKLTEWLVTRQKIPKDWHKRLQVIQAKANEAFKDVPPDVVSKLTEGPDAPLDYLRAVEIRDQLASTAERTMFGGLSGAAAIWDKIVKAYEKQYVFLGECGQALVQNVDFEILYLRRQAAKLNQTITDCERKHAECVRNAATCAAKYKEECKKLGITGVAVRQELRGLASELPGMLREVVKSLHDPQLQTAAEYYAAFTRFAHAPRGPSKSTVPAAATATSSSRSGNNNAATAAATDIGLHPAAMLPTLFEIRAQQTQPPPPAEVPSGTGIGPQEGVVIDWDVGTEDAADANTDAAAGVLDIDWDVGAMGDGAGGGASGDAGEVPTAAAGGGGGGINWDIDFEYAAEGQGDDKTDTTNAAAVDTDTAVAAGANGADGNVGDGDTADGAAAATSDTVAPITIDWDIQLEAVGDGAVNVPSVADGDGVTTVWGLKGVEEEGGSGGGDVSGAVDPAHVAAARLERDADYRARLLDDLLELRAFLAQRKSELAGGGGSELLSTALPESVSSVDAGCVGAMLGAVQRCLAGLHSQRFRQLLLIATSIRYLDRLEASLQRQAGAEAKLLRAAADVVSRQHEARGQLVALAPRVAALVARSRRLKALAERSIAAALGGKRSINVLGEINNVLAAA